jgi:hypothetical protein
MEICLYILVKLIKNDNFLAKQDGMTDGILPTANYEGLVFDSNKKLYL